jgi:cytochrome c oxidase assembly factor CtaG
MTTAWAHTASGAEAALGWSFEPLVVIPSLLVAVIYWRGSAQLRRRSRTRRHRYDLLFWAGLAILALALMSPLHQLGTQMFAAHMIEHELLMVIAAPLLIAARPAATLLWGLPGGLRSLSGTIASLRALRSVWRGMTELWTATLLHTLVLWLWHAPALFRPVLASESVHALQHASFLFSAIVFWAAVLRHESRAYGQGTAVIALFLTSLQAGLLGALLTFSRTLWYPFAPDPFPICGLTRGEDQSLAGLIMWIPACSAYALAAVILMARWLSRMETRHA